MSQQELLIAVARMLDSAGVGYFVTGSMASSLQGEPRATHDIDVVVEIPVPALGRIAETFPPPRWYFDESSARESLRTGTMFNLIDSTSGDKVDFWPLTGDPFDVSRMMRRRPTSYGGITLWVSSPEDTILMKLKWARLSGGSAKQLGDARGVLDLQGADLDRAYLARWIGELGVAELWAGLTRSNPPSALE